MAPPSTTTDPADRSPLITAATSGAGLALIAYAATHLLHRPGLLPAGLGAAAALAVLVALAETWHRRRTRPVRDLTTALAPLLRTEPAKAMIKARKHRNGTPTRLTIRYGATFDERDEKARAKVREIIATRLGGPAEATWKPTRRQILVTVDASPGSGDIIDSDQPAAPETTDPIPGRDTMRTRTTDVVQAILGASAHVDRVDFAAYTDTPTGIDVTYATTTRDLAAGFRDRVLLQINSKIPGNWRSTWDFENNRIRFELRPPFPTNVRYPITHQFVKYELPYAVTEHQRIESWALGSKNPHCLVVGPTGSGKTVFIRNLVVAARVLGIPVVLCDPKMTEYLDFEELDGVTVITETLDIAEAITLTHREMMSRYRAIKRRQARKGDFGKIMFILDEFFIFKEASGVIWQEMKARDKDLKGREHPCLSLWKRLAVLARTAEIHLTVGIQRPDAEFLTGLARDSFRMRISLDQATPEAARMMWGNSRIGTTLPNIQGRAVASTADGPAYVQVLRLLTPSDEDAFDAEDATVWKHLVDRMTHNAEAHANGDGPLAFLGPLNNPTPVEATETEGAFALPPAPAQPAPEPEDTTPAGALEAEDGTEEAGVYELEVGDHIELDLDTGTEPVEVADLHFGEDEDNEEEWVEIEYTAQDGTTGVQRLGVDDIVTRKTPATTSGGSET
ncbi:FtsK/SpoIIIE domain-containing protein [Streptomyces albireticuli]|uniref:FtsK domain-containing protein n=1 Tax=Streptomyces albireticuli TaxID=1940 RepID=A0A2A2DHF9_9ACTN|nr:FtsK/SpoIIIE domain-containing protein [Streptomyces albireticuli]MCD9146042.1 hypothetical protein [Streptomyces albireticuli]MCD9166193.1 hypothetical protein [Streptomyces albireticuli]MCD9196514.1 hypothetical protein [Streptomyces albireticuli]PAU50897.1 hypothetical protein CK936_00100 [Streptomyces albireticuli]